MLVWCDIQTKMAPYSFMFQLYVDIFLLLQILSMKVLQNSVD